MVCSVEWVRFVYYKVGECLDMIGGGERDGGGGGGGGDSRIWLVILHRACLTQAVQLVAKR